MAHYAKPLSFLLLIWISTSLHVEARERLFFSKVTHTTTTTNNNAMDSESPQLAPAPAVETKPSETSNGYGLYGQESNEFLPTTTKTTAAAPTTTVSTVVFPYDENEIQTEKLSDENYKKEETAVGYTDDDDNNNSGYSYNQNMYNVNGYTGNYNGRNGYVMSEKLGMSDTRFMEHGKYFYNAKSENNYYSASGYGSETGNGNIEGYDNGNGENEFDSMEEYERQQGYYPQSQEEYVP
ncbi:protein E6-like [Rhododendron vialii]|uniref:protein E6-like n=1 Tax=Rhododendron vialii TaxID=182163 RepID=UPI00265E27C7|nr:protein E6-like [Rhododendron vialii]